MNYVESLDILGVEAKEIPCIKGTNAPTNSTPGAVGVLYITQSGSLYKCVSAANGAYTWEQVCEVLPTRGSSEKATMSQKAISDFFDKNDRDIVTLQKDVAAIASKALRNDKRITNFEAGIPDADFIIDNSVAYVRDVPSNALPFAEVTEIGGATYKDGDVLRSAPVYEVVSEGDNIWDEVWENGYFVKGVPMNSPNTIRSVNFIRVEPNTAYFARISTASNGISLTYYDANKTYLGESNAKNEPFTTPNNCKYLKIYTYTTTTDYGKTYSNDICINKYDEAINGKYFPYIKRTLTMPEAVRNLPDYGVGIPNTDYFNRTRWRYDEATDKWVREYDRPMKTTNLGTLNWQYGNLFGTGVYCFYAEGATDANNEGTYSIANILCHLYDATTANEIAQRGTTGIALYEKLIVICDTNYTNAATFKAAMSGVMLVYELATHEITDISHLLPEDNLVGVQAGGTMKAENEFGYDVPMTVRYRVDTEVI